ncbi:MAG: hypothetical protein ACRD8Z_21055 [Nitrososphaeraceae archaeon]
MILSSNNVTSIIALTTLILLVAASFFVQTYFANPIAQQIREQTQFFDQDRSNLG